MTYDAWDVAGLLFYGLLILAMAGAIYVTDKLLPDLRKRMARRRMARMMGWKRGWR